jgi:hypothetical protein
MNHQRHFDRATRQSRLKTFVGFLKVVWTVIFVPKPNRGRIFRDVAKVLGSGSQPVQPPIEAELKAVRKVFGSQVAAENLPQLSGTELLGLMGVLMQFTCYDTRLWPYALTPFEQVERLYQQVLKASKQKPLTFSDQLHIALAQTNGDLPESLWLLMITNRLYARWLDTDVITGMPKFSEQEIYDRMLAWNRSLAACKLPQSAPFQDVAGDTYYCWTHVLSQVAYTVLPRHRTLLIRVEAFALRNGTRLNKQVAEKFSPQAVPSNHTVAAKYGNAIGELLAQLLEQCKATSK